MRGKYVLFDALFLEKSILHIISDALVSDSRDTSRYS